MIWLNLVKHLKQVKLPGIPSFKVGGARRGLDSIKIHQHLKTNLKFNRISLKIFKYIRVKIHKNL